MSSLLSSLLSNARALAVHSYQTEVVGRNLANASNPDYARQRANVQDLGTVHTAFGPASMGTTVVGTRHLRDQMLDGQIVRENANTGSLEAQTRFAGMIETSLGEQLNRSADSGASAQSPSDVIASSGLTHAISNFFNGFHEVSASPTEGVQRELLIDKAQALTRQFHDVDARIRTIDTDIATEIAGKVDELNVLTEKIADLNLKIARYEQKFKDSAVDLRDERQTAVEKLGSLIDIETDTDSESGMVNITVQDASGSSQLLVDRSATAGTVAFDAPSGTLSVGAPGVFDIDVQGGYIGGALAIREGMLPEIQGQIDELARQLVTEVNTVYSATGTDFFDTAPPGFDSAAGIAVNASLVADPATFETGLSGNAGDTGIVLALAGIANKDVTFTPAGGGSSFTGTFSEDISRITAVLGQQVRDVNHRSENQSLVDNMMRQQRDAASGVSIDQEVTDLMRYQRAFQASSRVVSVIDGLLDNVVNRMGA